MISYGWIIMLFSFWKVITKANWDRLVISCYMVMSSAKKATFLGL